MRNSFLGNPVSSNYFCAFETIENINFSTGFNTLPMRTITQGADYVKNNIYEVQKTGLYLISGRLRVSDNSPSGSFGFGVHTSNRDGTFFNWSQAGASQRQVENYLRIDVFQKGDGLRVFLYGPSNLSHVSSAMSFLKIG